MSLKLDPEYIDRKDRCQSR